METQKANSFVDYLLIAPPHIEHAPFRKSVIFVFSHDKNGAMGLVLNRLLDRITLNSFFQETSLEGVTLLPIYEGGPEESERSFILYTQPQKEYEDQKRLFSVTPTLDFSPPGKIDPPHILLTLGYTSWEPGQLEDELQNDMWLLLKATPEYIFHTPVLEKWSTAIKKLVGQVTCLAPISGHA